MLKKIILTLLLLAVTLLTVSAGCIIVNPEPTPTPTPTPTSAPTTPVPTQTVTIPHLNQGETLDLNYYGNNFQVSITGKKFGGDVDEILSKASPMNPKAESNEIAVMLKFTTKYVGGIDNSFIVDPACFEIYVDGVGYEAVYVILPKEYKSMTKTNILKGASYSGWLTYIIPTGNEDFGFDYFEEPLGFIKVNY